MSDNNMKCQLGKSCPEDPAVIFVDIESCILHPIFIGIQVSFFSTEQLENDGRLDEKWRLAIT